jgi:hypothetical protein
MLELRYNQTIKAFGIESVNKSGFSARNKPPVLRGLNRVWNMEQKRYEAVVAKLNEMTPSLVQEVSQIFQSDPDLVERYGNKLPDLAKQEVIRLRELLAGSILLDYPTALGRQLQWLVPVALNRNYSLQTVQKHLQLWRSHLCTDLPSEYGPAVLKIFDQAVQQMQETIEKHTKDKKKDKNEG